MKTKDLLKTAVAKIQNFWFTIGDAFTMTAEGVSDTSRSLAEFSHPSWPRRSVLNQTIPMVPESPDPFEGLNRDIQQTFSAFDQALRQLQFEKENGLIKEPTFTEANRILMRLSANSLKIENLVEQKRIISDKPNNYPEANSSAPLVL